MTERKELSVRVAEPTSGYADAQEQQRLMGGEAGIMAFRLRGQLLSQGRTESVLAASEALTVRLKVYASGGENILHSHTSEDHVFLILAGGARFESPEGPLVHLRVNEGILLPKGAHYRFLADEGEPLVMLRVGAPNESFLGLHGRMTVHGDHADADFDPGLSAPVPIPSSYFG
jgi:mannose-6-phosphate isomerase-like protein (cupin superfamily)